MCTCVMSAAHSAIELRAKNKSLSNCRFSLASHTYFPYAQFRARPKGGKGRKNTYGVTRHIVVGTAGMLAAPIKFKISHDIHTPSSGFGT